MKFEKSIKTTSIDELNDKLNTVGYDRENVTAGILHIGVGNFHRSHEEYYTNELLNIDPSQSGWGICGAMLLPQDEKLYRALESQGGLYTVTLCGCNGINICHEIGSLTELIWAPENPQAIIDRIADPNIKIISMTITEGGYNLDRKSGKFNMENDAIRADIENPSSPHTIFGFLAEGLRRRRDTGGGPVTLLSCDNLQHNGDTLRFALTSFLEAQDPSLIEWVDKNVTFPNSMVDRITPATSPEDVKRLNKMNSTNDLAPIYCEEFSQWVIEDKFAAGRPEWEKVGVMFTDDVTAYENMKLNLLNASHTLMAYPALLCGYRKVDDAIRDERILKLVRDFMDSDTGPHIQAPGNMDLECYKQTVLERFGNNSVSDQITRLCSDGLSKFPVYIIPNLKKMIDENGDLTRIAYLIAAYRHYLKYGHDDNGITFEVNEPCMKDEDYMHITNEDPIDFLKLSIFNGLGLEQHDNFKSLYNQMVTSIYHNGAMTTLEQINNA